MIRRKDRIRFKMLPNGNIRGFQNRGGQDGVSEAQFINPENTAPTVIAGQKIRIQEFMAKRYRIRKLTPTECFRLMGVDDESIGKMRERISDSQCYKLAGNSIVVDTLVEGIFRPLLLEEPEKTTLF